jgi:hypothetical protein
VTSHPALQPYLDELVERIGAVVSLDAAYLVGSGAYGAFEAGRSDVDLVAVVPRRLTDDEKRAIVAAAESVPGPGRKLELVVYARGHDEYELNLNTGELASFDPANDPPFWFVLDRAIAEQHAVPLLGAPWAEVFEPVAPHTIIDALRQSLDWHESEQPLDANAVLNACRAWKWVEGGEWASKPEAAAWLHGKVRAALEQGR